ncbi:MAG: LytTR family DNA-binding domain-containing protein [Crocinitomicaceae bacterium]
MIKSLIIDDEKDARYLLKVSLEQMFSDQIEITDEASSVLSGVKSIQKHRPDLVFLDVKMRDGTGFDLLDQLDTIDFEIIFVTAYDKYAIRAFQFSAFGYILKPFKKSELESIINKLSVQIKNKGSDVSKRVKILIENYVDKNKIHKLVLSNVDGFKVVNLTDLIRLEGDGNYTNFIILNSRKVTSSKNLREYEDLLVDHGFFRIHQSTIVNLRHVTGFKKEDGGRVEMSDGESAKLSRYRKADFMERFL